MLNQNKTYTNEELINNFKIETFGGIRFSKKINSIFLFSTNIENDQFSCYENFWDTHNKKLHYIGKGSSGNQEMEDKNLLLANSKKQKYKIYFFETLEENKHTYRGEFSLKDCYIDKQKDLNNELREVFVFTLNPVKKIITTLPKAKRIVVVAAITKKQNKILIAQRQPNSKLEALKWEFPGGKVELKEQPEATLKREIDEELGIDIDVKEIFHVVSHTYKLKNELTNVLMLCYLCEYKSGDVKKLDVNDYKWETIENFDKYEWAAADIPVIEKLKLNKKEKY